LVEENITFTFRNKGVQVVLADFKSLEATMKNFGSRFDRLKSGISNVGSGFKKMKTNMREFSNATQASKEEIAGFDKYASEISSTATKLGVGIAKITGQFQAWAMSVMFFGMLIQRTFDGILKAGTGAFTKIMEASNIFGTAIQRLGLHWDYLKFTIGSAINTALAPLLPKIIEIIHAVTNWIQQNPKLAAWLIIIGLIVGTLLFLFGTLTLGTLGLIKAIIALKAAYLFLAGGATAASAATVTYTTTVGGATVATTGLGAAMTALYIVMALVALYIIYLIARYNDLKGALGDLLKVALVVWKYLALGFMDLANLLVFVLLQLGSVMWKSLLNWRMLFVVAWWGIKKVVSEAWNGIVKGVEWGVNRVIDLLNKMIGAYNSVAGALGLKGLGEIARVNFGSAKWEVESFTEAMENASKFNEKYGGTLDDLSVSWVNRMEKNRGSFEANVNKQINDAQKLKDAYTRDWFANTFFGGASSAPSAPTTIDNSQTINGDININVTDSSGDPIALSNSIQEEITNILRRWNA
jgi:hypothetical protein